MSKCYSKGEFQVLLKLARITVKKNSQQEAAHSQTILSLPLEPSVQQKVTLKKFSLANGQELVGPTYGVCSEIPLSE